MSTPESLVEDLLLHDGFVRALARNLLGDRESAEEVAQDVWVAALEGGQGATSLPRWLTGVVKNLAGKLRRGDERRDRRESESARAEATPSAEEILEREAARTRVIEAVLALEEPYRSTIFLRYLEGLPLRVVAKRLGLPVETVRTRSKRALEKLRARLDDEYGGERGAWALLIQPFARAPLPTPLGRIPEPLPHLLTLAVMSTQAKIAVSAAGVALIVFLLLDERGTPALSAADEPESSSRVALQAAPAAEPPALPVALPTAGERAPVSVLESQAPAVPDPLGSVRVHVSWFDGSPADGIRVLVEPNWHDEGLTFRTRYGLTDALGETTLEELPEGAALVKLDRGQLAVAEVTSGDRAEVELTLPRGFDVVGIVRDPTGAPVAGADVWVSNQLQLDEGLVLTQSDAQGRFGLLSLPTGYIGARANGFAPSLCQGMYVGEGAELALELVLMGPGGAITGTVLDPEGRPLARAWVGAGLDRPRGGVTMAPVGGDEPVSGHFPGPIETRTDAEGHFRIEGLAPGTRRMAVRAEGFGAWRGEVEVVEHQARRQDVRLPLGVSLVGRVLLSDGSKSPANATIEIGEGFGMLRSSTGTDSEGLFRLDGLEAGELSVRADAGRGGDAAITLHAEPGETLIWEAKLSRGGSIRGLVLDEAGEPLVGWKLQVQDEGAPQSVSDFDFAQTDGEGRFVFQDMHDRPHRVELRAEESPGFTVAVARGIYPDREELVLRVEPGQIPSTFVLGRILDELGEPIDEAQIILGRPNLRGAWLFHPAPSGDFEIGPLPPGEWVLRFGSPELADHPPLILGPRNLGSDEVWDCGTLVLDRGGNLLVEIDGLDLGPEVEPIFLAVRTGSYPSLLEQDGEAWRSAPLTAGPYELQVRGRGIAAGRHPFEIRSGEMTRLALPLQAGVRLEVFVHAESTGEMDQPWLRVQDERGRSVLEEEIWLRQDAEGNALLGEYGTDLALTPGRYRVEAWLEDGRRGATELSIEVEEPASVALELR